MASAGRSGRRIMFTTCPFIRPIVHLSVAEVVNTISWKQMNRLWCKLVHGTRAWNHQLWGQEVEEQGHRRPKYGVGGIIHSWSSLDE